MAVRRWAYFASVFLIATFGQTQSLSPQGGEVKVLLINGKSGKPMKHERLLVFFQSGQSHTLESEGNGTDPHTDENGYAVIPVSLIHLPYMQVWVDFRTLCQADPNHRAFSISQVVSNGASTPNDCGKATRSDIAGTLIVYARPSTLKEKMAR